MSVAEKIKQEIIQPQKNNNGLLVGNRFTNHLDIHGVTRHG